MTNISFKPDYRLGTGGQLPLEMPSEHVPAVSRLASRILELVEAKEGQLDMTSYHNYARQVPGKCGTVHCLAGWAVYLAGDAGYRLERSTAPAVAGALIWTKAYGEHPNFSAIQPKTDAMDELRRFAAQDPEPSP